MRNLGQYYHHPASMSQGQVLRLSGGGMGDIPSPPPLPPQPISASGWNGLVQTVVDDFASSTINAPTGILAQMQAIYSTAPTVMGVNVITLAGIGIIAMMMLKSPSSGRRRR